MCDKLIKMLISVILVIMADNVYSQNISNRIDSCRNVNINTIDSILIKSCGIQWFDNFLPKDKIDMTVQIDSTNFLIKDIIWSNIDAMKDNEFEIFRSNYVNKVKYCLVPELYEVVPRRITFRYTKVVNKK